MTMLFDKIEDARSLAQIVVETVREPLLVLDNTLKILVASSSFYKTFQISPKDTPNKSLFALDDGGWDIPALHDLLERSLVDQTVVEGFLVAQEFPRIGPRIFLLHARKVLGTDDGHALILLGFEDITERRAIEQEKELLKTQADDLLQQKEVLLAEMQHRIVNSLQIIASILMLKARAVTSEETRQHLQDAHRRVMSVAAVQQHLHSSGRADTIDIAPYLSKLCESLAESMIGESRPAKLTVTADEGFVQSADAISLGLIVTELVINALKYAFPDQRTTATVKVDYEVNGTDWKLSVSDNGIGRVEGSGSRAKGGLGTSLVKALAHQLDAQVETVSGPSGMSVSVTHATFVSRTAA
ncbi:MAG TPA: histidine kinase dimerization/phosphoacceptor domain -containing protein [Rhizomicrobium sp.]|nr:histidine kinase dimerization/phosphoacceptor domain -containing protein [Rhizomicrobium sp.]